MNLTNGDIALIVALLGLLGTLGVPMLTKKIRSPKDDEEGFRATIKDLRESEAALRDELEECERARGVKNNRIRRLEFLAHNLIRYAQSWEEAVEAEGVEIRRRIRGRVRVPMPDTTLLDKE